MAANLLSIGIITPFLLVPSWGRLARKARLAVSFAFVLCAVAIYGLVTVNASIYLIAGSLFCAIAVGLAIAGNSVFKSL